MVIRLFEWMVGYVLYCVILAPSVRAAEPPAVPPAPLAAVTSPTTAAEVSPTSTILGSDPVAVKWLRAMEEKHRDHRRASGEIIQTKKDPVFLEERRNTGKFYYERPNRFRCDYDKPEESTTLVDGDLVSLYFPGLKQLERYRLSQQTGGIGDVNQMLLAFGIETDRVLKHFTVMYDPATTANIVRLTFVPKAPIKERPFSRFILEVTKPDLTPKRFEIVGEEDDRTAVIIKTITWNPTLPPDIFRLNPPRDVEIIE